MQTLLPTFYLVAAVALNLRGLLVSFLILVAVLAVVGGLLYCIETWIAPIPGVVKLVVAIILLIIVVIWAANQLGAGI